MDTGGALKKVLAALFRLFPFPVEPGLRSFGHPDETSPVLVTANFRLTASRVASSLRHLDCYLLVAPTGGINVWCAAKGGNFTARSIVSVLKTSQIDKKVAHRTLVLPQLAAPGIDTRLVERETGWGCRFGPVYAGDIPEYLERGFHKNDGMRRVKWPLPDRLDVGFGVFFPLFLLVFVILALFLRDWLWEFAALSPGLTFLAYGLYPFLPGKAGWHKLLALEAIIGLGLLGYVLFGNGEPYVRSLFYMALALVALIGIDFGGTSPLEKSFFDPLMDRLGIVRIGPVTFKGRAKIAGSIALDAARCSGCGICCDVCPRGVLEMEPDHGRAAVRDASACVACEGCIRQCPEDALRLSG